MTSTALLGLAQGLGQGVADVGKMAFAAQIEEQRMARLRQYQKEDYQQQRADKQADYTQQRADTRADMEDQRGWQSENEQHLYERGREDSESDYQRNRRDAAADRAHSEGRADQAAKAAAMLKADKWSSLQPVKSRDEFGNEQITGFVGSKGGQMQMIDLQSGRIIPLADDQQRLAALSQLDGYEIPASSQAGPGQAPAPQQAPPAEPAQAAAPAQQPQGFEQQLAQLTQQHQAQQARYAEARNYQPVTQNPQPRAAPEQPRPWQSGSTGLLSYPAFQR